MKYHITIAESNGELMTSPSTSVHHSISLNEGRTPLPPPDPFAFDFWLIELLLFNNSPFVFSIFVKVFSILALEEMVGEVSRSWESLRTRASASILMNDIFLDSFLSKEVVFVEKFS